MGFGIILASDKANCESCSRLLESSCTEVGYQPPTYKPEVTPVGAKDCDLYYKKHYGTSGSTSPGVWEENSSNFAEMPWVCLKMVAPTGWEPPHCLASRVPRPGKRLRNELEHHHAMKMGKSTIFDGAIFYVANCKRLPEGKTCKWDNPS